MSNNSTTVVPTYQFQNDGTSYSNISFPQQYNNGSASYLYQSPSSIFNVNPQQIDLFQYQNLNQANYPNIQHNQYPNYDGYNYETNRTNNNSYKINNSQNALPEWQQCEASNSVNIQQQQSDPCAQVVQVLQCYHQGGEEPEFVRKAIEILVKKLKDKRNELDALISAITNGGKEPTICVTIQRSLDGRLQVAGRKGVPHVVYARIWRWPNVNKNELQKMDVCTISNDHPDLICINPYHYERVVSSNYGNMDINVNQQLTSMIIQQNESSNVQPNTLLTSYNGRIDADTSYMAPPNNQSKTDFSDYRNTSNYNNFQQPYYAQMLLPLSQTRFFMYGKAQQPNYIMKHNNDGTITLINNSLPSFSNDTTDMQQYQNHDNGSQLVIDRYNAIRQIMNTEKLQETDIGLSDWCSINYYELDTQIGETFHVPFDREEITIDGGTDPGGSRNGRFCLGALSNVHRTEASERARAGIGKGIKLTHYRDGSVILDCNSLKDVFVRSYYLDFENNLIYGSTVHKFGSGTSKKVFDLHWASVEMNEQSTAAQRAYAEQAQAISGNHSHISLLDHSAVSIDGLRKICCTIAISFVKGWGAGYNRSSLKDTPCWVELQLHRPLKLLNRLHTTNSLSFQ